MNQEELLDVQNTCVNCGKKREDMTEIPWGGHRLPGITEKHRVWGIMCQPCEDKRVNAKREENLAKVAAEEYDELDYCRNEEVVCPHCAHSYAPDSEVIGGLDNEVCDICGGKYRVEVIAEVTYSTEVVGERLLK